MEPWWGGSDDNISYLRHAFVCPIGLGCKGDKSGEFDQQRLETTASRVFP